MIKKLGIKPEMKILVINKPEGYFEWLGANISDQFISKNDTPDIIHLFAKNMVVFKKEMVAVLNFCKKNKGAIVWVSWYKKSAGMVTDISENMIRDFALQNNLVDVKVCAVSEQWSGLKLVVPISKR